MKQQQTSLMVLRVWTEQGSTAPLRVDVRESFNVSRGIRRTRTLTDIDLVLAVVRRFLETGHDLDAAGDNGNGNGAG